MRQRLLTTLQSGQLNNGLTCYINCDRGGNDGISVCLTIKAGAGYEKDGQKGWFHLLTHLSVCRSLYTDSIFAWNENCFRAFDYAYTSFYESTYYFKAIDVTGELLRNSIITARGILEGAFLEEEYFCRAREDVLEEYEAFTKEAWYVPCFNKLGALNMTFPTGKEEDILQADYEKLKMLHREYYRPDLAAVMVSSPQDSIDVYHMLQQIFSEKVSFEKLRRETAGKKPSWRRGLAEKTENGGRPYILMAWYPREKAGAAETLKTNMLLALLAKSIELSMMRKNEVRMAVCNVEIFQDNRYLFQLSIMIDEMILSEEWIRKTVRDIAFTPELFETSKNLVLIHLKKQFGTIRPEQKARDIIGQCRKHFLFEEPVIALENAGEVNGRILRDIKYNTVREGFEMVMNQFA